jgi:hypothetical protein
MGREFRKHRERGRAFDKTMADEDQAVAPRLHVNGVRFDGWGPRARRARPPEAEETTSSWDVW